jgi:hypothetical protein
MADENEPKNNENTSPDDTESTDESRGLLSDILGGDKEQSSAFRIQGRAALETLETVPGDIKVTAYAFDSRGQLVGRGPVDAQGNFDVPVRLQRPENVDVVIGPADDPAKVRDGATYTQSYQAEEWVRAERGYVLRPDIFLPRLIWWPWLPARVCVSGHVSKAHGGRDLCSVPYAKVEIFDVDREGCWWPFISRWWELLRDRMVIRVPDLLKEYAFERKPGPPDPIGPISRLAERAHQYSNPGVIRGFNPQPDPPGELRVQAAKYLSRGAIAGFDPQPDPPRPGEMVSLNPQPEPPGLVGQMARMNPGDLASLNPQPLPPKAAQLAERVGEVRMLAPNQAAALDNLTITSRVAPWVIFPRCFYSRQLICTTYTDCEGYFRCCFRWWPWHFRQGRLRFDSRPDIIIRVTQTINGVDRVIYMDPYTSTRWNVNNATIDLHLDDEDIVCNHAECPGPQPHGPVVFLTRVGYDEVYKINQTTGLFSNTAWGGTLSNWAYGEDLRIYAQFGDGLTNGATPRYYRLSYRKGSGAFVPITTPLSDTRVAKTTLNSETHALGPQTVNGTTALYEVRDFTNFYWYNPDWIGDWDTTMETDTDLYTLRLEVFDQNGVKLNSPAVDYRDGTHAPTSPPTPLPPMADHCDLKITIDNKYPTVNLTVPAAMGDCGVVPWSAVPTLTLDVDVDQENGRLYYWGLSYVKGTTGISHSLASASNGGGLATPVSLSVSGAPMTAGLTGTCAFAITLDAWPLVRNGVGVVHYNYEINAIAIERCPECKCPPQPNDA